MFDSNDRFSVLKNTRNKEREKIRKIVNERTLVERA